MKQLSVRGFGRDLERRLRGFARERGISLNKAALLLMRRGAGLDGSDGKPQIIGHSLDKYAGKWSKEESESTSNIDHRRSQCAARAFHCERSELSSIQASRPQTAKVTHPRRPPWRRLC